MKIFARWADSNTAEIYTIGSEGSDRKLTLNCNEETTLSYCNEENTYTEQEVESLSGIQTIDENDFDDFCGALNTFNRIGTHPPRPYIPSN